MAIMSVKAYAVTQPEELLCEQEARDTHAVAVHKTINWKIKKYWAGKENLMNYGDLPKFFHHQSYLLYGIYISGVIIPLNVLLEFIDFCKIYCAYFTNIYLELHQM